MKKVTTILTLFILLAMASLAWGATYYVDPDISDEHVASATPDFTTYNPATGATDTGTDSVYKTLADLTAKTFSAGDTIYFKKGGKWYGSSNGIFFINAPGSEGLPITIDAFGSGNKPLLMYGLVVGSWESADGNGVYPGHLATAQTWDTIYGVTEDETDAAIGTSAALTWNSNLATMAAGQWWHCVASIGAINVTVDATAHTITRASGDFTAEGVRIGDKIKFDGFSETNNQAVLTITDLSATVVTCSGNTLTDEGPVQNVKYGTDVIYYKPSSDTAGDHVVYAHRNSDPTISALTGNSGYITINNLDIRGGGIYMGNTANNITINSCNFQDTINHAAVDLRSSLVFGSNITITNNTFYNNANNIYFTGYGFTASTVSGNGIYYSGLTKNGSYYGAFADSADVDGITCQNMKNTTIENNEIAYGDCWKQAGITIWYDSFRTSETFPGNVIRNNYIHDLRMGDGINIMGSLDQQKVTANIYNNIIARVGVSSEIPASWESSTVDSILAEQTADDGNYEQLYTASYYKLSQSFTGNGDTITAIKFKMKKSGSPTGPVTAYLYSHSGVYGTSSVPNEEIVGTNTIQAEDLTTTYQTISFTLTTPYETANGTNYVVVLDASGTTSDSNNKVIAARNNTNPFAGNYARYNGSWNANAAWDAVFTVAGTQASAYTYIATVTTQPKSVFEDNTKLSLKANSAEVEATSGSWFWESNVLYIHPSDDGDPDTNGKIYSAWFTHTGDEDYGYCHSSGLFLDNVMSPSIVANNVIYQCGTGIYYNDDAEYYSIVNNVIMNNLVYQQYANSTIDNMTIDYNCIYPTTDPASYFYYGSARAWSYWTTTLGYDENSQTTDPSFLNANGDYSAAADFKIGVDSPCLNAGMDVSATVTLDYWDNSRPQGSAVDIGVYEVLAATVTTQDVSDIEKDAAVGNGTIVSAGDGTISENGIVVNTTGTPTTADDKFTSEDHSGAYTADLTSLTANTHYYARAYGITGVGTVYGSEVEFDTESAGGGGLSLDLRLKGSNAPMPEMWK